MRGAWLKTRLPLKQAICKRRSIHIRRDRQGRGWLNRSGDKPQASGQPEAVAKRGPSNSGGASRKRNNGRRLPGGRKANRQEGHQSSAKQQSEELQKKEGRGVSEGESQVDEAPKKSIGTKEEGGKNT